MTTDEQLKQHGIEWKKLTPRDEWEQSHLCRTLPTIPMDSTDEQLKQHVLEWEGWKRDKGWKLHPNIIRSFETIYYENKHPHRLETADELYQQFLDDNKPMTPTEREEWGGVED